MTDIGPPEIEHVSAAFDTPLDCTPNKEVVRAKWARSRIQGAVLVDRGSLESENDNSCDWLNAAVGEEKPPQTRFEHATPKKLEISARLNRHP
jgi:hypothetical protein